MRKIREKTGNKAQSTMTLWNALKEVETAFKGWSNLLYAQNLKETICPHMEIR